MAHDDVRVGEVVNVPGGMHGTVKYLGPVAGKAGRFAGVELSSEHAQRGKNSGDVDGRKYFVTSIPGAGIFVPMNNNKYVTRRSNVSTPTTPARGRPVNFSKSVSAALTTPRPRVRRPSLPRPESPRVPPPKLSLAGLRTPSAASRTSGMNSAMRSPVKAPSRLSDRPSSRLSVDDDASSYGRPSDFRQPPSSETQELKDQIKSLEKQLLDRDKQLDEQSGTLNEFQKTLEEMEGPDGHSVRTQLRERNERIIQLTAEFDVHRADFRSTLDTLEIAASETERVYEQRLDELMQQNKELQDRGEDVEIVAQQLKQLEELVSELEEGLEDARRGEAEARAEVEFLRGEVERTKLELKKERDNSAAALKDAHATTDGPRSSSELDQKDDEIRGLKAIIHSLSRGNPSTAGLGQNSSDYDHDPEHINQLEIRLQEIEENTNRKDSRIEELECELKEMHLQSGSRRRSSTVTLSPKQHRPSQSGGNISNHSNNPNSNRLSDRTVVPTDWHDAPSEPRHRRDISNSSQSRLETMHESERSSDEDTMWCEICETGGHDILNCTSMFGSGKNTAERKNPAHAPDELADEHLVQKTEPLKTKASSIHSDTPPALKTGRDVVMEGLKGIGGLSSSMAPIAGKSSGVIDESKWCALCERDGHESIDCPFDE
ncbi:Zinc finger CCHC-type [Penicillium cf. griseofulvum]|uniref:Zinc finger CCHC-type n=1 Tax=Penicillium cf. griseofulvum TaxID=2972120 RepID=A0A9W9MZ63_9EURO|nr:Zinc finger CCHC-type [Penicillium cf. griseofulvum]KAJ5421612.1 Zinc finger CCHC-type [Penicillium cf. griseofulvum]KAJ5424852.1 Zinc finger CCHC-type [Penicillium cf. griseofulvum]